MKIRTAIASIMFAAACFPAQAEDSEVYAKLDGWVVFRGSDSCNVLRVYEGDTTLYVSYTVGTNDADVIIADPAFKSIQDGEKYPVNVYFQKAKALDDGWGEVKATGMLTETLRAIRLRFVGTTFLQDLKSSTAFGLMRNDGNVVVASLNLDGSAAAVAKLEECSMKVHRQNPADPFAG